MLLETDRRVRDVGFLQCRDLLGRQFHINGSNRIVELMQLGGANDRRGDDRLRQEPSKRNPRHKSQTDQFGDARRQDSDQCQKRERDRADDDKTCPELAYCWRSESLPSEE